MTKTSYAEELKDLDFKELQLRRDEIKNIELKKIRELESSLKSDLQGIEEELIRRMDELGVQSLASDKFKTSITRRTNYPVLEDRQLFEEFVLATKSLHLFQGRISTKAVTEEIEAGISVPGIELVTKRSISQRKT